MADNGQGGGSGPITTIPPFSNQQVLPQCATSCGPLHNANGACVPPAVPQGNADSYESCFCGFPEVSALSSTMAGVCDNVCEDQGLQQIQTWFQDLCGVENSGGNDDSNGGDGDDGNGGNGGDGDDGNGGNGGNGGSGNDRGNGEQGGAPDRPSSTGRVQYEDGGDWLSNHWQWVVMLVVLVVAIAGIWVGACIWRRRYVKKKERQRTWAQKQSGSASRPSWGPGNEGGVMTSPRPPLNSTPPSDDPSAAGSFMPNAQDSALEKGQKKRWIVKERT